MSPTYGYNCTHCGCYKDVVKSMNESGLLEVCDNCGEVMERTYVNQCPAIVGTRDSFGIGKEFEHNGQVIDNWKDWEKAGFRDAMDDTKGDEREKIKEKTKKIKRRNDAPLNMGKYKALQGEV